jgi:hypothetical protein
VRLCLLEKALVQDSQAAEVLSQRLRLESQRPCQDKKALLPCSRTLVVKLERLCPETEALVLMDGRVRLQTKGLLQDVDRRLLRTKPTVL